MGWVLLTPLNLHFRKCRKGVSAFAGRIFVLTHGPKVVSSPLWNRTLKGERATLSLRQILSPLRIPHSYGKAVDYSECRSGLDFYQKLTHSVSFAQSAVRITATAEEGIWFVHKSINYTNNFRSLKRKTLVFSPFAMVEVRF